MGCSKSSGVGVTGWAAALCAVALSACLNPMPDDFPNEQVTPVEVQPEGPGAAGGAAGLPDSAGDQGAMAPQPPAVTPPSEEAAPSDAADAGVAPDGGPGAPSGRR